MARVLTGIQSSGRPHLGNIADSVADSLQRIQVEFEAGDVACLIMEPIQSDGGLIVPPPGFMKAVSDLCKDYEVLFICDEVKVTVGLVASITTPVKAVETADVPPL